MSERLLSQVVLGECMSPYTRASENLAFEQLLAADASSCFLTHRDRPCVSIGFNQDLDSEVDLAAAYRLGVDVVRRASGGGAVYRDGGCICFSFVVPRSLGDLPVRLVVNALDVLGLPVERGGRNDLFYGGKKVSGMAWESLGRLMVVHGTLLHSTDLETMDLLVGHRKKKYQGTSIESVHARVANFSGVRALPAPDVFQEQFHRQVCALLRGQGARVEHRMPGLRERRLVQEGARRFEAAAGSCNGVARSAREMRTPHLR
jgi:lipoate-protein ligase A